MIKPASNKRRWLRYSLRSMLLVMLLISAWLAWNVNRASRQRRAVAHLGSLEAMVTIGYDFEVDDYGEYGRGGEPPGPTWLREIAGVDILSDVEHVSSFDPRLGDSDLRALRDFPNLKCCRLMHVAVTDDGAANLSQARDLRILELRGTDVTDDVFLHLIRLRKLEVLELGQTNVTDAGLVHLQHLPELIHLDLGLTKITNKGLRHVAQLTNLRSLWLISTPVTEEGLVHIAKLPRLRELDLRDTHLRDGAAPLLGQLTQLETLYLDGTRMTAEAIHSVRESLPATLIHSTPAHYRSRYADDNSR